MTDRLTLIIPTYNRPDFLERVLRYYASQRVRFPIVVADSSPSSAADANRRIVEALQPALAIRYERHEPEIHVAQKIARALDEVPSPYAALGADDDFSIPASLERGAAFLASHPDYALVHGEAVLFQVTPAAAYGRCLWVARYPQRAVEGATGAVRLLDHLSRYSVTFYSLHRTERLRQNWRTVAALELDYAFVELLPSCLSVIQGKCKQLRELFLVRQAHAAQTSTSHLQDPLEWVGDPRWSQQQAHVRNALAEALIRQDGLSSSVVHEVVKQAFWAYLAGMLQRKWHGRYGSPRRLAGAALRWRTMVQHLPGVRQTWHAVRSRLPGDVSLHSLCSPSSSYYADFMPTYRLVTEGSVGGSAR